MMEAVNTECQVAEIAYINLKRAFQKSGGTLPRRFAAIHASHGLGDKLLCSTEQTLLYGGATLDVYKRQIL